MDNPEVTVLMPVYNGEKYLREAIESILMQTFNDFEFLIINDGSTDKSVEIINSYDDKRIRLVHNKTNLGLIKTLNTGIDIARSTYIARMDCDDISLPNRLIKQVNFMDGNPDTDICGSWTRGIGKVIFSKICKLPADDKTIKCYLLFNSPLAHPTIILRRETIKKYNLYYDVNYKFVEDYELWVRASKHVCFSNLNEVLLLYRLHTKNVSSEYYHAQQLNANSIRLKQLENLNIKASEEEKEISKFICNPPLNNKKFVEDAGKWLLKIKLANDKLNYYPEPFFSEVIGKQWYYILDSATGYGLWITNLFLKPAPLSSCLNSKQKANLIINCLLRWSTAKNKSRNLILKLKK